MVNKRRYINFYADSVSELSRMIKDSLEQGYVPVFMFHTIADFKERMQIDYHVVSELSVLKGRI